MTTDSDFAPWFKTGRAIPVMHPIPWVYAEVFFPDPYMIEWRIYNYATDELSVETFELVEDREETIPEDYSPPE